MADAALVNIGARCHIVQTHRFEARAVVLRTFSARIGWFGVLNNDIKLADSKRHGHGRGYRAKQICDGEKPSQPSSTQSR